MDSSRYAATGRGPVQCFKSSVFWRSQGREKLTLVWEASDPDCAAVRAVKRPMVNPSDSNRASGAVCSYGGYRGEGPSYLGISDAVADCEPSEAEV